MSAQLVRTLPQDSDDNLDHLRQMLRDTDWNINSAISAYALKSAYSRYHNTLKSHLEQLNLLVVKNYLAWFPFSDFTGLKAVGHGASAKVFSAYVKRLLPRVQVALKELSIALLPEVVLTTIISSRSTPPTGAMRVFGLSQDPEHTDKYIMVMEFAEGGDLAHYSVLNGHNWSRICALAWRMAVGLEASVHQAGLVHGDLHGGNIVFTYDSTSLGGARRLVPRIIDVGLSRAIGRNYNFEETLGNQVYTPPEYFTEGIACKNKASYDIYCFGTLMWQLVAGVPPRGTSAHIEREDGMREDPIPGAPDEYMAVIHACWRIDPTQRPTMQEIVRRLHALAMGSELARPRGMSPADRARDLAGMLPAETRAFILERAKERPDWVGGLVGKLPKPIRTLALAWKKKDQQADEGENENEVDDDGFAFISGRSVQSHVSGNSGLPVPESSYPQSGGPINHNSLDVGILDLPAEEQRE